jgi:hypothetical protein
MVYTLLWGIYCWRKKMVCVNFCVAKVLFLCLDCFPCFFNLMLRAIHQDSAALSWGRFKCIRDTPFSLSQLRWFRNSTNNTETVHKMLAQNKRYHKRQSLWNNRFVIFYLSMYSSIFIIR